MLPLLDRFISRWRRRHWRPSAATSRFATMRPLAVVTGASEGIGRALALEFSRNGHGTLLVARSREGLEETAALIRARGGEALIVAADLATSEGADAIERALEVAGAYADVLVNNAGIGLAGPYVSHEPDAIRHLADLNMRAPADLMRRFLPGMLVRGRGGILNVASLGGLVPGPNQAAYYASKAFLVSLTEAVARECAGHGVQVSVLVPGPVATKFHARMGAERSYYLPILGAQSVEDVARAGYRGLVWGRVLIPAGIIDHLYVLALRLIPHTVTIPVIGWMLRRRSTEGDDASGESGQ